MIEISIIEELNLEKIILDMIYKRFQNLPLETKQEFIKHFSKILKKENDINFLEFFKTTEFILFINHILPYLAEESKFKFFKKLKNKF